MSELAPLIEESGILGKRAAELKITVSEYEREARDLMKSQSMAKLHIFFYMEFDLLTPWAKQPWPGARAPLDFLIIFSRPPPGATVNESPF